MPVVDSVGTLSPSLQENQPYGLVGVIVTVDGSSFTTVRATTKAHLGSASAIYRSRTRLKRSTGSFGKYVLVLRRCPPLFARAHKK